MQPADMTDGAGAVLPHNTLTSIDSRRRGGRWRCATTRCPITKPCWCRRRCRACSVSPSVTCSASHASGHVHGAAASRRRRGRPTWRRGRATGRTRGARALALRGADRVHRAACPHRPSRASPGCAAEQQVRAGNGPCWCPRLIYGPACRCRASCALPPPPTRRAPCRGLEQPALVHGGCSRLLAQGPRHLGDVPAKRRRSRTRPCRAAPPSESTIMTGGRRQRARPAADGQRRRRIRHNPLYLCAAERCQRSRPRQAAPSLVLTDQVAFLLLGRYACYEWRRLPQDSPTSI